MKAITSWGRLSSELHHVLELTDPSKVKSLVCHKADLGVAYGVGRSYGDVCLNSGGMLWKTRGLDHFIEFDERTGRLICEAGVLLRDIQRFAIPRGWTLAVTPGTQLVTVGGAIANDVHGKNHHFFGSFGNHVLSLCLIRTDGEVLSCGPNELPDWFAATVGGLGLTGLILQAEIQLRPVPGPWLEVETVPYADLDEFYRLADDSEADWEHTVSWIDCSRGAGRRGLFMRGNPSSTQARSAPKTRKFAVPVMPPFSLMNRVSLSALNAAYYHLKKWQTGRSDIYYEAFFYPLDNLLEWNRMYGPKGFYQYQSVVPCEVGRDATKAMLNEIAKSGEGSFLAVLKTFGNHEPVGMLSFPQYGTTLAVDFPNNGDRTHKLFDRLDAIVREAKGRLYPAKDARMPRELFEAGYPHLAEFIKYRDPGISSDLSRRLMGS